MGFLKKEHTLQPKRKNASLTFFVEENKQ